MTTLRIKILTNNIIMKVEPEFQEIWANLSEAQKNRVMSRLKNNPNNPYTNEKNMAGDSPWYQFGARHTYNQLINFLADANANLTEAEQDEVKTLLNLTIEEVAGQQGGRRRRRSTRKSRRTRRRSVSRRR